MKVIEEYLYHGRRAQMEGRPGHHYVRDYEKTEYYCPNCGKQAVWICKDGGDYYLGEQSVCTECKTYHHLDTSGGPAKPEIVEQLTTGVTTVPKTPQGR